MKKETLARIKSTNFQEVAVLGIFGVLAGLCNGLLGAGGGILAVFGILRVHKGELLPRDVYAGALCVMLPLSVVSCLRYGAAGHLSLAAFKPYLVPSIIGGIVGAILLGRIKNATLGKLFGALVVWSGLMLILR